MSRLEVMESKIEDLEQGRSQKKKDKHTMSGAVKEESDDERVLIDQITSKQKVESAAQGKSKKESYEAVDFEEIIPLATKFVRMYISNGR